MVQKALSLFWSSLGVWHTLFWSAFTLLALVGLGLLLMRLNQPELFKRTWPRVRAAAARWSGWAALAVAFVCSFTLLGVLGHLVQARVNAGAGSSSVRTADPDAAPTTQAAPTVTYLTEKKYLRSLTIPPELLKRVKLEGMQALSAYLQDPQSQNLTKLVDRFRRRGRDLIFTREATLVSEVPVKLDQSRMNLTLDFVNPTQGARRTYYNASFAAQYAFTNPLNTPVTARFYFPLPEGSGTLADYRVVVDGQELTAADLENGSYWQGSVPGGKQVSVQVTYRHQGARGWSYLLGTRREPIRDFSLNVSSNQAAKFKRYSLYPTRSARTLGSTNLSWELKNVITAQDIALTFSSTNLKETLGKLYSFVPFALAFGLLFGVVWAFWRGLSARPLQVMLALLGLIAGTALGGVLMNYFPAFMAGPLGAGLAAVLALRGLGSRP